MSLRQFGSGSKARTLALRGMSLSLGALMLAGSAAVAQTTPSSRTPGDVIVNTEPERGGSTNTPSPSGQTTSRTTNRTTVRTGPTAVNGVRFKCQPTGGQPTVMYFPENRATQAYPWAVPSAMGGGWDSDRRCNEIARRLESYRPDGLVEMKTGTENGYNTVCVTTDRVPSCRIVFTVPPGQDPASTRDRVFQNLTVADSGQRTEGVYTYGESGQDSDILNQIGQVIGINGRRSTVRSMSGGGDINLKPFLSPKDGGTGEKLTGGVSVSPSNSTLQKKPSLFLR